MKRMCLLAVLLVQLFPVCTKAQVDGAFWWGYYEEPASTELVRYLGLGQPDTYDAAILLRNTATALQGATIQGLRFQLRNAGNISGVKAWMSHALPATGADADICVKDVADKELKSLGDGYVEVVFDAPYALVDSLYLGFTFTVAADADNSGKIPLCCAGQNTHEDAFFFRTYNLLPAWQVLGGQKYGDLMLQALVANTSLAQNAVVLESMDDFNADATQNGHAAVRLTNKGAMGITSLTYTIEAEATGEKSDPITYEFSTPITGIDTKAEVLLPVVGGSQPVRENVTLTLQAVNEQPNESGAQSLKAQRTTLLQGSRRRVLFEEYTGTWCGWCPRGTAAMEWLSEHMDDDVVLVAVHQGDPMEISAASTSYSSLIASNTKGYPKVNINRNIWCDPYHGTDANAMTYDNIYVQNDVERELAFLPEAAIDLKATWNENRTGFMAETDILFQCNIEDAPYALAFVLLADGLKGTGTNWTQSNSYAALADYVDYFTGTPLVPYVTGAENMTGVSYDRVAVAAWNIQDGIANVVKAPLKAGEKQTYSFEPTLPTLPLVKDKDKLRLVAILLNTETGRVVNAAISNIDLGTPPSGIAQPISAAESAPYTYDLQGRRTKVAAGGVYIQRQPDGTSRKYINK